MGPAGGGRDAPAHGLRAGCPDTNRRYRWKGRDWVDSQDDRHDSDDGERSYDDPDDGQRSDDHYDDSDDGERSYDDSDYGERSYDDADDGQRSYDDADYGERSHDDRDKPAGGDASSGYARASSASRRNR